MSTSSELSLHLVFVTAYLGPPLLLVWGWLRWHMHPKLRTVPSTVSLIGFILATVSALLALGLIAYAQIHHFPYYDPFLLLAFRIGALLSLCGIVFGIAGVWRPSSLRWHSPASGVLVLFFWILMASGE